MKLKHLRFNFPLALLNFMVARVPSEALSRAEAMSGELEQIAGPWARFRWAFSGSIGLGRIWVRSRLQPTPHERKPLPTFVLITLLIRHLPLIQPPRSEAFFFVLFAFLLTAIPAVISLGLWLLDDAARIMAIFFTVIHALGNLLWLLRPNGSWKPLAVRCLVLDFLIIGTLMLPAMRRAFHAPPVKLNLSA